jgi:hypothetical protein
MAGASVRPLNFTVMRASAIACAVLLFGCASHPAKDVLTSCLESLPHPDTLPGSDAWTSVSADSPQVLKLRQVYVPTDPHLALTDPHSYWFSASGGYLLQCLGTSHYKYGEVGATVYIPEGAGWKAVGTYVVF